MHGRRDAQLAQAETPYVLVAEASTMQDSGDVNGRPVLGLQVPSKGAPRPPQDV